MKKILVFILCAVMVLSLFGCGATKEAGLADNAAMEMLNNKYTVSESADEMGISAEISGSASGAGKVNTDEKIIKTVEANVQTKEYDAYISSLTASVSALGGYIEKSDANFGRYSNSNRFATYVVRIPAEKLNEFLVSAEEKGRIINKTEKQENVTLEYVDLESRIDALKTEKATLTSLLEKAESLESVLAVQDRLTEVNYQIESYTAQLKVLTNRVSYSTVTLTIDEVERVSEAEPTVWQRIKIRFADNLENLVDGFKDAVVEIIGGLPVIIPAAACIVILILIIRKIIRKRRG